MGLRLSPQRFNQQSRQMGQKVLWKRASMCPCRDQFSGQPTLGCPRCGGKGTTWAAPVESWAAVTSLRVARQWADTTQWATGDMPMTLPADSPLYAAGENDRFLMVQSSIPFATVVTAGAARLNFTVAELDRCYWLRPGDQAEVDVPAPVQAADGTLSWPDPATAPDPGAQVSIAGRKRPEYYVFQDIPQDRAHFGGAPLPRRVQARLFDLFGR